MALKFNFTKALLDELTCPDGKSDIMAYDTDTKGLAVRVTKAGGKTFFVVRKVKGRDHRIKLDVYDKRTTKLPAIRKKAETIYTNVEAILEEKTVTSLRDEITVERALDDMIEAKVKLTQCTIKDYRKTYKNHLKSAMGNRTLMSITTKDVTKLHTSITAPVVKRDGTLSEPRERSANKALSLLGSIFAFAIVFYHDGAKKLFEFNPVDIMTNLKRWHENKRSSIRINPEQLNEFISECIAIADTPPLREVPTSFKCVSAAVLFMLFSGIRPGEISKIRREFIHHPTRSIIFPKRTKLNELDTLKNGQEFHLVLNDSAYCQLLYAMKHSTGDYVFSGVSKERISESNVRDFLIRIQNKINNPLPRKIMRATFISMAERAGVGAYYIKVLCNHDGNGQTVDVTDGYKSAYLYEIRDATEKVERDIYEDSQLERDFACRGLLNTLAPLDSKTLKNKLIHL
jgi:integrase